MTSTLAFPLSLLLLLGPIGAPLAGQKKRSLSVRLGQLMQKAEKAGMRTGVWAAPLAGGKALFAHRDQELFVPASNQKILTAILALEELGPGYVFETRFRRTAGGALHVESGGDPSFSRAFRKEGGLFDPVFEAAKKAGIEGFPGGLVLDLEAWPGPIRPPSWPARHFNFAYAAPTAGYVVEGGCFYVRLDPKAAPGSGVCGVFLEPAGVRLPVRGKIKLTKDRKKGGRPIVALDKKGLRLSGAFYARARSVRFRLPIPDPVLAFRQVLRYEAGQKKVSLGAQDKSGPAPKTEPFAVLRSPLAPVLKQMLTESDNFIAEMLPRVLAWRKTHKGSLEAGRLLLQKRFHAKDGGYAADGSGLSEKNRLSPAGLGALLLQAARAPYAKMFRGALPIGGVSGTLKRRFRGHLRGQVRAKTGTLRSASALSGYLIPKGGKPIVFVILMNATGKTLKGRTARSLQDQIVTELAR
ncbi:MAG TPA: D-alanyl-D-alanine carboxypeptidase/D-alanyl-D-alanine-endopeptidase [Planctomycetes bacterium]|nr:D-alanyl-D-alanine carboxypeptidase/D-alanyl-D-alanine-endopeptidase [Planctomycetota bacterium]